MLRAFGVPLSWSDLAKRTAREVMADNCFGLAAQLAYYFFLALFPALLFLFAIVSFIPVQGLLEGITASLAGWRRDQALTLIQDQILNIAHQKNGGLLTLGMIAPSGAPPRASAPSSTPSTRRTTSRRRARGGR